MLNSEFQKFPRKRLQPKQVGKILSLLALYPSIHVYIYIFMNRGLTVSEKSVLPTSFGCGRFQGNLFLFEKHKWLQKLVLGLVPWEQVFQV